MLLVSGRVGHPLESILGSIIVASTNPPQSPGFRDDLVDPGHADPPLNAWYTNLEVLAPQAPWMWGVSAANPVMGGEMKMKKCRKDSSKVSKEFQRMDLACKSP